MTTFLGSDNNSLAVALGLAAGFPIALLIFNELINSSEKRNISITPTLRTIRNLVLPTLVLTLFIRLVAELPREETWVRLV